MHITKLIKYVKLLFRQTIINVINTQRQHCRSFFDIYIRSRRGRDRIVVGFTTTDAINAYHH